MAQTLGDLREQLRENLRQAHFASALVGMVMLADDLELSGAHYRLDDSSSTEIDTFVLPFRKVTRPWGQEAPGLYFEGAAGVARADESTADVYGGLLPQLATSVRTEWRSIGGLVGAGLDLEPVEGLHVAPILDVGLSWLQNRTDYGGPGAAVTAALADGIAFNWDALAFVYGGAVRVDWQADLGGGHRLECAGRYDLRWTDTVQTDDPAQDFAELIQVATARADVTGPLGWELLGATLGWRATVSYRRFLAGDIFGVEDYVQVGGGVEFATGDSLPVGSGFTITSAAILGDGLAGWSLGVGMMF
jgi:hypothetical protein